MSTDNSIIIRFPSGSEIHLPKDLSIKDKYIGQAYPIYPHPLDFDQTIQWGLPATSGAVTSTWSQI